MMFLMISKEVIVMQKDPLLSKESKNIEYKVQVPEHSEKYIKRLWRLLMETEDRSFLA